MPTRTPDAQPLRCAIYTRKSTAQGLEQAFNSLDAQREACLRFIQNQPGWAPCPVPYQDGGFSGSSLVRPGFQSLMADLEAGVLDVVAVYKVDRLSRSLLDFARVMERFSARGVAFVSVTQNFSTADAMGRLTLNMLMSFAEFEREMITERIRDKVSAQRRKGCWTGGMVPFGYRVEQKRLVVVPEEAKWVGRLFQSYLGGMSVLDLVQTLNAEQVPFKSALKPRPDPWSKAAVIRLLRNRLYTGSISSHGSWYPGQHETLIDAATFDRVQGLLAHQSHRIKGVSRNAHYLVRGTLKCGACGAALTSASTRRRGRTYRYYRCTTREKKGKQTCPTRQLSAEALEAFVVDQLRRAIREGRISAESVAAKAERIASSVRQHHATRELLLNGQATGLSDPCLSDLEREIRSSEEEEAELRWVAGILGNFDVLWDLLSPGNQQRLVQNLVKEVVVAERDGLLRVTLRDLAA